MAATMKMQAAEAVNKGHPSSFYPADKNNPVLQAMDQEIKLYVAFMKKRTTPGYKPPHDEPTSRSADTLFQLWNKYEPRLPKQLYHSKLLEMGDFLLSINEFRLAMWQCYGRYLKACGEISIEEITNVNDFKKRFFPDGYDQEDTIFTFRALMGVCATRYQVIRHEDARLQRPSSMDKCLAILRFLRLLTQSILPKETLCWIVYNGTVHIYDISRHLLTAGRGGAALEFVIWACMCMETSVPLMAVRYLTWRATLYTCVCQCYYDVKMGQNGEAFARRAISKINELSQLESMSSSEQSRDTEMIFRHSTLKMAAMIFKQTVYESRRKPKGLLRPKTRANLKDAVQLPWPRTPTEKLLAELVEGSAGQMLLILEALSNSHRRTLVTAPPAPDADVEILDVNAELFMAAQEIISGGGGTLSGGGNHPGGLRKGSDVPVPGLGGLRVGAKSLIEMASRGEDGIPISCLVTLAKLAYSYEQWELFDNFLGNAMTAIREVNDPQYSAYEKMLELMFAHDKVVPRAKHRKLFTNTAENDEDNADNPDLKHEQTSKEGGPMSSSGVEDSVILLAEVLLSIATGPYTPETIDVDMMIDATLLLWKKCKDVFQKFQTGSTDNPKYLHKMTNPSKWVYVLDIVHQLLGWTRLSVVDPALTAEVVLRLALVFEASAHLDSMDKNKKSLRSNQSIGGDGLSSPGSRGNSPGRSDSKFTSSSSVKKEGSPRPPTLLPGVAVDARGRDQLLQARDILELGLQNIAEARNMVSTTDGRSIADVSWCKELNPDLFAPLVAGTPHITHEKDDDITESESQALWNTVKDLNVELLFMYHRVTLKLANIGPDPAQKTPAKTTKRQPSGNGKAFHREKRFYPKSRSSVAPQDAYIETFDELVGFVQRNYLSKALLYMQKAAMLPITASTTAPSGPSSDQKKYLEDAVSLIKRAEQEEKKLYIENVEEQKGPVGRITASKVPPPPILLCRTETSMLLRPAPFKPASGQKVAWYRLFCRSAVGSNVKVRLNDYTFSGCGEEIPAYKCELRVTGLSGGEKYHCAVAAYTAEGKLIGDSIGESTRPILASHPMPVLMCWSYLCQVAYQVGEYAVAKDACRVLWSEFVADTAVPAQQTYMRTLPNEDFNITLHKLNSLVVIQTSPVLLRMFLTSLFIHTDINVRQGNLFPDRLCDNGSLTHTQFLRLRECEYLLIALELAGWLNEGNLALQAVVQCYGLLTPLVHHRIPAIPVVQVLERCLAVLQEIPVHLRVKRPASIVESLNHMIACLTYHIAKVLRNWNQRALASTLNEQGRKMLATSTAPGAANVADDGKFDGDKVAETPDVSQAAETTVTGSLTIASFKKKRTKRGKTATDDSNSYGGGNEELRALEAHMLRISKQAQGDHELTGGEEPSLLHAYIAYLPAKIAIKEVNKFRRRARYLEFFVQTVQKALSEGNSDSALEWCHDCVQWMARRNEQIMGGKTTIGKQPGAITVPGDADPKKYAAALVEYGKEKDSPKAKRKGEERKPKVKKMKYKPIGITPHMSDAEKAAQETLEVRAIELLSLRLVELYHSKQRRRKLRRISMDERPWRAQLNMAQGLAQFGVLLNKMEARERVAGTYGAHIYSSSFLDPEWFEFETAGTMVVSWQSPAKHQVQQDFKASFSEKPHANSIAVAAMAATGKNPPPMFPIPAEEEDTPRTYRSNPDQEKEKKEDEKVGSPGRKGKNKKKLYASPNDELSQEEAITGMKSSMKYFTRAVVHGHRGGHWTLLQNAARSMWNCAHMALMHLIGPDTTATNDHGRPFISVPTLRSIVTPPFFTAADLLCDMMLQLQASEVSSPKKKRGEPESDVPPPPVKSVLGSVQTERGGAGLKFDPGMDDVTTVDVRWFRRLVLRVLEMLYYEQQWEKLVDLALRFNALSDDRYSEQVNPLLVQAQRNLIKRVHSHGGPPAPQPHFAEHSGPLLAKQYTRLQLKVVLGEHMEEIGPGAMMDPAGSDIYSGGLRAMQLCSVPLDVEQSLQSLRTALSNSTYTARALQHSRKLLVLYLSGLTATIDPEELQRMSPSPPPLHQPPSHVGFDKCSALPQSNMPRDISQETFTDAADIQSCPLPKTQISLVISSYEKTIELLLASNQKGLAAEAMRELGNVHYHAANIRAAFKWWCESLDTLLGVTDALHKWRGAIEKNCADPSQAMLEKCGMWGCMAGGILASNIAQYVLTSDLGMRTETCFLAGYMFKAVFRASLPHPNHDKDYALYEVGGEGSEVSQLVPGIDLLSERFRLDGRTLMAALRYVMEDLVHARHNLFVLPLITLYLHLACVICRDVESAVWGRVVLARALTDLGLYSEAAVTLQKLLYGERLPHPADTQTFRPVEGKVPTHKFLNGKPIMEPVNVKVLENLVDKRLSMALATLYGPNLSCMTALVHAHFLISLANTIPVLPIFAPTSPGAKTVVQPHTISEATRAKLFTKKRRVSLMEEEEAAVVEEPKTKGFGPKVDLEKIKGTLLSTADTIIASMLDVITTSYLQDKGLTALTACELEVMVLGKIEQAIVAQQRHHGVMAARLAHSAMTFLKQASIFHPKQQSSPDLIAQPKSSALRSKHRQQQQQQLQQQQQQQWKNTQKPHQHRPTRSALGKKSHKKKAVTARDPVPHLLHQNHQSRTRLDARLWLSCRLGLVKSMLMEVRGLGEIKGSSQDVEQSLGSVRHYCAEGVAEAEAAGDVEMYAEFFLQGAMLNLIDGRPMTETRQILLDVQSVLARVPHLSIAGQLLQSSNLMLLTDLQAATGESNVRASYMQLHDMLLNQMEGLGEQIESRYDGRREFDVPASPMQNLYTHQCLPLVQAKLRLGIAMAAESLQILTDSPPPADKKHEVWTGPLGVLTSAFEISKVVAMRIASVEAEVLLNMGKLQRQLFNMGHYKPRVAANTLIDAITTSFTNDHNLSLIRQAYLEIALIYQWSSAAVVLQDDGTVVDAYKLAKPEPVEPEDTKAKKKKTKSKKEKPSEKKKEKEEPESDKDQERRAAWLAVRCATSVGESQQARALLVGQSSVTSKKLNETQKEGLPEFVTLDLVRPYVLGKKNNIYKDEIEQEMASLTETLQPPPIETYSTEMDKIIDSSGDLSWTHILGYQTILQRLCSTSTLLAANTKLNKKADNKNTSNNKNNNKAADNSSNNIDEELERPPTPEETPEFDMSVLLLHQSSEDGLGSSGAGPGAGAVRYMSLSEGWAIRLNHLHAYLQRNQNTYGMDCCATYPPRAMMLNIEEGVPPTDLKILFNKYVQNLTLPPNANADGSNVPVLPAPGSQDPSVRTAAEQRILSTDIEDVCVQWFSPTLEEYRTQASKRDKADRNILMIYSLTRAKTADKYHSAHMWVPARQLRSLHDRLSMLLQRAEISLVEAPKKEATVAAAGKGKKQARIKALSPKVQRDERLETLLRQCLDDAYSILGYVPPPPPPQDVAEEAEEGKEEDEEKKKKEQLTTLTDEEVPSKPDFPFEVNKSNLYEVERLFNPGFGLMVQEKKICDWMLACFPN